MKWPALFLLAVQLTVVPGHHWQFPRDDGPHPAYSTEWWYFTGVLQDYGFELTFFRVAPDLYFTHFAISDLAGHHFSYWTRARRAEWGEAGADGHRLWDENWSADFGPAGPTHLHAAWSQSMSLDLTLTPGPRMLNGVNGYSQKGPLPGEASYYYSYPHITARGAISGHPVSGLAWMDHEFSSGELDPSQQGWDWMGLHLPSGDLMLFQLRDTNGQRDAHSAGTWLPHTGVPVTLTDSDFTMTPTRWWNKYPVVWNVYISKLGLHFQVSAKLDDQLLHDAAMNATYWEGAVGVSGASGSGEGYLELTGYGSRFNLLQSGR